MKRQVSYQWRLREKMAAAGMFTTSELAPPLAQRGINPDRCVLAERLHELLDDSTGRIRRRGRRNLEALCPRRSSTVTRGQRQMREAGHARPSSPRRYAPARAAATAAPAAWSAAASSRRSLLVSRR